MHSAKNNLEKKTSLYLRSPGIFSTQTAIDPSLTLAMRFGVPPFDGFQPREYSLSSTSPTERALPVPFLCSEEKPKATDAPAPPEPQSLDDESLMASLQTGNQEALAELFRRYSRLVLSIGLRILRDAGEAEETTQDIFLFLFERAAQFDRSKGDAKAWIVQIAYHRSLDRQNYLHRRSFYSGTNSELQTDTLTSPHDVEREVASKLSRERLKEAFESLSEKQRHTLELFFFEELDFKEIALRLGETLENVRHFYYRGIQKLRKDGLVAKLKGDREP